MTVHVLPVWIKNHPYDCPNISTVSNSSKYRDLSPFLLGPIEVPSVGRSENFENLWQYSKVYKPHVRRDGEPTPEWFDWRAKGFADKYAHRYPIGKGSIPMYSWWKGEHLGYIEARKKIYAPVYAEYVVRTTSYTQLAGLYSECGELTLRDYDAYDHIEMGMSLINVINNPDRKMGHAFVLAMLLEGKLEECLNS
ncbi:hypothetical protein ES704_01990 [subsurface metagenome]